MSRLTLSLALTLGLVSVAAPARGEGDTKAPPSPRIRWDLGARVGHAASWTTAQSFLGAGTGLAGGVTFRVPIRLELGVVYHAGTTVSAANRALLYWSRQWSMLGHAGVGYDISMFARRFVLRPRLVAAGVFVSDTTQVGAATRRGIEPVFGLGPAADILVRFGALHAGVDARALFVPSRVAAPIGGIYGVFGFER